MYYIILTHREKRIKLRGGAGRMIVESFFDEFQEKNLDGISDEMINVKPIKPKQRHRFDI